MRARSLRGFTLIEIVVVLGIVAVIAGISLGSLNKMQTRASYGVASNELVSGLRRTRAEAFGRATQTAFIIDTVGGRWWGIEAAIGFSVDTFNPASPGTVIVSGTLPTGTSFGPTAGYAQALAAPLAGVPMLSAASPNYLYCSFCNPSTPNVGFGMVTFQPGATATFSGLSSAAAAKVGQQFTLTGTASGPARYMAIAIVARTGATQVFER